MADSNSTKHKMNMQKATNRETKLILHFKMPKKNASEKMNSTNQPASLPASHPVSLSARQPCKQPQPAKHLNEQQL